MRRVVRSPVVPASAKQQLSRAVQDLLQQLFTTVTQDSCSQQPGWDRCGCYLLLRALTRSQQFLQDPGLPVLPEAAVSTLKWVKQRVLGTSTRQDSLQQAAHLSAQDDKPFLLLTRLVLTATGAPAAVAAAAAESDGAGYYAAIASAVSAAATKGSAAPGSGVRWSDAADTGGPSEAAVAGAAGAANGSRHRNDVADAAAAAAGSACVRDPELLCELLDWSGTKVKLALQRLLEPAGGVISTPLSTPEPCI